MDNETYQQWLILRMQIAESYIKKRDLATAARKEGFIEIFAEFYYLSRLDFKMLRYLERGE